MSYTVFCTFDLKNASYQDYELAYKDLNALGLKKVVSGTNRNVVIPTTAVLGSYTGTGADAIRDHVSVMIRKAFASRNFTSEIFVVVGGPDSTWGSQTT